MVGNNGDADIEVKVAARGGKTGGEMVGNSEGSWRGGAEGGVWIREGKSGAWGTGGGSGGRGIVRSNEVRWGRKRVRVF